MTVVAGFPAYFGVAASGPLVVERPLGLDEASWAAIGQTLARLNRAITSGDLPLLVGSAKELVEATAKVVLAARGETVSSGADYGGVLTKAHAALDRQPGTGLAADAQVRTIAQSAKTMAAQLNELRNRYGTGHGRAEAPDVADELALVTVDGALLWTRWACRRLQHLINGRPDGLVRDLDGGGIFFGGDLRERLAAARLSEQDPADQHRIGMSVARRAMRNTFLVMSEGVEECTESTDFDRWPLGYRVG